MPAWNIKVDDSRTADTIITFIIFCEDEVCEVLYLKQFETATTKINLIEKQNASLTNVLNAIAHCQANGLLFPNEEQSERIADDATQVWCVFDRDFNDGVNEQKGAIAFNESIKLAKSKGFKVAWSNDAFELWLLLHFEEVEPGDTGANREYYYDRLTQIFLLLESENASLKRVQVEASFKYKSFLKTRKNFKSIVLVETAPLIGVAIERAKALEAHHNIAIKLPSEMIPCTMMHHLVFELQRFGETTF